MPRAPRKIQIEKQGSVLPCFYFSKAGSTNDLAKEIIVDGKICRGVVVADKQTAGRGRYGRTFLSPKGGVYLSYFCKAGDDYAALGLFSALAAVKTLAAFGVSKQDGFDVSVKWPNDVKINGKKVCGILPESIIFDSERYVVVGIGLNVNATKRQLGGLSGAATSIRIESKKRRRVKDVAAALAKCADETAHRFFFEDRNILLNEYAALCDTVGKQVKYTENGVEKEGAAIGVEADGSLTVRMQNGATENIGWGEITEIV